MGFDWKLFLRLMEEEGILLKADVEFLTDHDNLHPVWMGFVVRLYDKYGRGGKDAKKE